jgi:hypothetical protein
MGLLSNQDIWVAPEKAERILPKAWPRGYTRGDPSNARLGFLWYDLDIPSLAGGDPKQNGEIFVDLSHIARLCRRGSLFRLSFIRNSFFGYP